jgi:hypothetical protein
MPQVTGLTRGGSEWIPQFVTDLNQEKCIGSGPSRFHHAARADPDTQLLHRIGFGAHCE